MLTLALAGSVTYPPNIGLLFYTHKEVYKQEKLSTVVRVVDWLHSTVSKLIYSSCVHGW